MPKIEINFTRLNYIFR